MVKYQYDTIYSSIDSRTVDFSFQNVLIGIGEIPSKVKNRILINICNK